MMSPARPWLTDGGGPQQENEQVVARIIGLEGVVRGLREERALWSRELAAQGAGLAADRGKLEAQIR